MSACEPGKGQSHAWLGLSLESLTQPIRPPQEGTFVTGVPESQALGVTIFSHLSNAMAHGVHGGSRGGYVWWAGTARDKQMRGIPEL